MAFPIRRSQFSKGFDLGISQELQNKFSEAVKSVRNVNTGTQVPKLVENVPFENVPVENVPVVAPVENVPVVAPVVAPVENVPVVAPVKDAEVGLKDIEDADFS